MASLFVLLALMFLMFLIVGFRDLIMWLAAKDEVKSVDNWNKFREFGEENRNDDR